MIPVSAIADDKVLDVKADDGQVHTEEHGGENYDRVNVKASNNSTANVNVGEVSNAGSDDPAVAVKTASATSNVQTGDIVSGDVGVNAKTNGENSTTTILTGNIDSGNWGVRALTGGENTITTIFTGNITAGEDGVSAQSYDENIIMIVMKNPGVIRQHLWLATPW